MSNLETYFEPFKKNTIGNEAYYETAYGLQKMIYADWIASGRLYSSIETKIIDEFGPMVGNTHSETSETGKTMTHLYHTAQHIIKQHVNASPEDVLITTGTGMTSGISKLHRILGLKVPEASKDFCPLAGSIYHNCYTSLEPSQRPIVFLTHIEHHSNHTSWYETFADVVVLTPEKDLLVDPAALEAELVKYADRKMKIGSFSACSNVTGYFTPYYELAKIMHKHGGICFVDFAASAPYVKIDMHPAHEPEAYLDGIFFSPHKFLGGPGSSGVLIFNRKLYKNETPDRPGGGTVNWTNPWGKYSYVTDIEAKEDGGTPGFIQAMRIALAIRLKEKMGVENIHAREKELIQIAFDKLQKINKLHILAENIKERLGVFSFYVDGIHHNLLVRLLNDRFGIQVRGGCSCAGTYGHFLLKVDIKLSEHITSLIDSGDLSLKPGWVRLSLHPTMTNAELEFILEAIKQVVENIEVWKQDYYYSNKTNEFYHNTFAEKCENDYLKVFDVE
jgi:selenocysteine lyase/cysteine desulfurase